MNGLAADDKSRVTSLLHDAYNSRVNDLGRSIALGREALSISRTMNDMALIGRSLSELSLFYMIRGEYEESMSMSEEAIRYFEELKDEKGIADAKYNIAGIYYKTDNYHLGLVYLIDCLSIYRKFQDYHNEARVQKSLGTIYEYFGDENNAVKSYNSSIEASIKAGDLNLESNAYNPLSGIYLKQGKTEKAMELIEKSIAMKEQTADTRGLAFAIYGRGKVYTKLGRFEEAELDFNKAMDIHQQMGERLGMGMVYYKMGELYVKTNRLDRAKEILKKALAFSDEYNIAMTKFKCSYLLYQVFKQENNAEKSLEYLERYLREKEVVINAQTLKVIENYELITKMESLEKEAQLQKEKAEIIEKKDRAEQSARIKQEFLSTMSHEIRTPLNAVITITSLLDDKSVKDEKQLLDSLKFASKNLLLLINDILDFTKLDSGKVEIEKRPVDFKGLMEGIKNTYESLAKEKGLELLLAIDSGISESYELDDTKISQVLGNLLSNAIKYTDTGKVDLEVEILSKDQNEDLIRFKISDTGIGIPEKDREEIFESFSQTKSITTKKQGGSGLGLAIVKKLIELHDSKVYVNSVERKGSVFYFDLKLKKSGTPERAVLKPSNQLKNKTVLLAEDNMINALVVKKLLAKWEMMVDHAINGTEAVAKASQKNFDFILMDIHMPEMNGFDAAEHIRKNDNLNKETPIYALTADITAQYQEQYIPFFNKFLLKPIEIDKLYEAFVKGQ